VGACRGALMAGGGRQGVRRQARERLCDDDDVK
jgi:hypothetical protein